MDIVKTRIFFEARLYFLTKASGKIGVKLGFVGWGGWGAVIITSGLVHNSDSLPNGQDQKVFFLAP